MTRRRLRAAAAAVAVLAATSLGGTAAAAPGQTEPVPPAEPTDGARTDNALTGLADCLTTNKVLALAFVFDHSGSLKDTDPTGQRVDAALTALDGLGELVDSVGGARADVGVAVFSDDYREVLPFTDLAGAGTGAVEDAIVSLRKRTDGLETDIVTALIGARAALADHTAAVTAEGGATPCNAILLFTDGTFELRPRQDDPSGKMSTSKVFAPGHPLQTPEDATAARDKGIEAVCKAGGIADQLRGEDTTLISVMLAPDPEKADDTFLRSLTTGTADGVTCGRPGDDVPGAFLSGSDPDAMIGRFDQMATRLNGGALVSSEPVPVCSGSDCDAGARTLDVDAITRRIRILGLAPKPGVRIKITGPGGEGIVSEAGEVKIGDASGTATAVAGRGFGIDIDRPADAASWTGTWTVELLHDDADDKTTGLIQLSTYTDLVLDLKVETLTRGGSAKLTATIRVPEGLSGDEGLASAAATARFVDPITGRSFDVALAGPPEGPFIGAWPVPAELRTSVLRASAQVEVTTNAGNRSTARSTEQEFGLRRPGDAVQFGPPTLDFPTVTGTGTGTATVRALGGKTAGCVWFEAPKIVGPEAAGTITVTYDGRDAVAEASCIPVPAGATVEIPVAIGPSERATGSVRGHLVVHEKVGKATTVTDVPIVGTFSRGIDETRRLVLAVILVLGGVLLPMALLWIVNRIQARFQRLDAVRGAVLPVRVTGDTIQMLTDGRPHRFHLEAHQFASLADAGSTTRFTFGGVDFRAKASRNPFGATVALAAPAGGAAKLKGGVGRRVELAAGLAGSWIFLLDPERTRRGERDAAEGTVLAFVSEDTTREQLERLLGDITTRLPGTAGALGAAVWSKSVKAPRGGAAVLGAELDGDDADDDTAGVDGVDRADTSDGADEG